MAKDTEKLIRQLSLISFLMAQGRPVSALEIKREVEGYSDMNDDAFARRFYADRAELESLATELATPRMTADDLRRLDEAEHRFSLLTLELRAKARSGVEDNALAIEWMKASPEAAPTPVRNRVGMVQKMARAEVMPISAIVSPRSPM